MKTLRREIHPEIRVIDSKTGLVEYVASDESLDSYREVIRAKGWRFDRFSKNAPFVDSHDYSTIDKLVGRVAEFKVVGKQLVETVQWAIDVPDNRLASLGFRMTEAGYLKAVSVGFMPEKYISKWNAGRAENFQEWQDQLKELGLDETSAPNTIFIEQQQIELSSCIIGANPNALAKSYKAGVMTDADLDLLEQISRRPETADGACDPAAAPQACQQESAFLRRFQLALMGL